MIKDEVKSPDDIEFQAAVGKETGSMYSHDACGQMLDGQPGTIDVFDRALGAVGEELREVGNPSLIQRLLRALLRIKPEPVDGIEEAVYYGCYFGQIMVKHHEWTWVNDAEQGYVIQKKGRTVQPDVLVRQRLTSPDDGMIVRVYNELIDG